MRNWHKVRQLSGRERIVLMQAVVALPVVAVGLRLFGLRRMRRVLVRCRKGSSMTTEQARGMAQLVGVATRHGLFPASCLEESLTLLYVLGRHSTSASLHLGVRKTDGRFEAHAWVMYGGVALNDVANASQRFSAFPPL